jgi:hypothetical protein
MFGSFNYEFRFDFTYLGEWNQVCVACLVQHSLSLRIGIFVIDFHMNQTAVSADSPCISKELPQQQVAFVNKL